MLPNKYAIKKIIKLHSGDIREVVLKRERKGKRAYFSAALYDIDYNIAIVQKMEPFTTITMTYKEYKQLIAELISLEQPRDINQYKKTEPEIYGGC